MGRERDTACLATVTLCKSLMLLHAVGRLFGRLLGRLLGVGKLLQSLQRLRTAVHRLLTLFGGCHRCLVLLYLPWPASARTTCATFRELECPAADVHGSETQHTPLT